MSSLLTKKPSTSILPFFFMGKSLAMRFLRGRVYLEYTRNITQGQTPETGPDHHRGLSLKIKIPTSNFCVLSFYDSFKIFGC